MKTSTDKSPRTRAKIIAELASLPSAIQGKICEDKRRLANGATAVYHNLQYWANGRNHTVRIPKNKLPAFREGCEADDKAKVVCVMADGTGMPMRKECLQGVKGKNGRAKTREVKAGAIFIASRTSDNEPHRDLDTTTYVATTHRREKFGKYLRNEFDRRFAALPETVLYITDGGKWLHSIHESDFPFAIEILDVYHAVEHIKPLMLGLGIKEGSKEWNYRHRYWSECIRNGKVQNVLDYLWNKMRDRLKGDAMREYKYFRSNVGRMKYDEYRANGWFIGSGVIESACKTVIGQRFKQSGMIWSLKGAKALIPLRTLHKSNRLEEFFQYLVKDLRQVDCAA